MRTEHILLAAVLLTNTQCGSTLGEEISNTKSSGPVTVRTLLEPSEPVIGDEVTLTIEVASEKDVEVLMPEFAEALERYTILDYVPRQQIESDGSLVQTQKYTLQPIMSGEQSIPPILIEFIDNRPGQQPSPDDFDAYEILTDRIDFSVQSVVAESAGGELKPPLGTLDPIENRRSSSVWLIPLVVLVVVAVTAGWYAWLRLRKRTRRVNAFEIAYLRLNRLLDDRKSPQPKLSVEEFFVEISAIVRQYLEDRFELRAPELTTDEFLQLAAAESQLSREHQSLLSEFLKQADIVKFAGVQATLQDVQHSSDLALKFMEETRENAPDVEVDERADGPPTSSKVTERIPADV